MAASVVRTKLPHSVIVKAPGLLPMLYKVSELAADLSIPDRTLRDWLEAGAPHLRDHGGRIWVNGRDFSEWVEETRKNKHKSDRPKLNSDQAYCLRCNAIVQLIDPTRVHVKGRLYFIKGTCPHCGCRLNRGDSDDRTGKLLQS